MKNTIILALLVAVVGLSYFTFWDTTQNKINQPTEITEVTGSKENNLPSEASKQSDATVTQPKFETKIYSYDTYTLEVQVPDTYTAQLHDNLAPKSIQIGISDLNDENNQLRIHVVTNDYCLYEYCFLKKVSDVEGKINWQYLGTTQYHDAGATQGVTYVYKSEINKYVIYVSSNQKLHTSTNQMLLNIFTSINI